MSNTAGMIWTPDLNNVMGGFQLWNLMDSSGNEMLAWIQSRPIYCDRGHWEANINVPCGLDGQDGFPRYYMLLETAKQEIEDFLPWRLHKVRAEL